MANAAPLQGVVIELRDARGVVRSKTSTNNTGAYIFTGVTPGSRYFVTPVPKRTEYARPTQTVVNAVPGGSVKIDQITIGGVRRSVKVGNAPAGTMVLLTETTYSGANPPGTASLKENMFLGLAGTDNTATLSVVTGVSYEIVCWKPTKESGSTKYERRPRNNSQATEMPMVCP